MTRTLRASGAPMYVAIALSLLALLVGASTTAFAAGLAANSVGSKQLKKNAVKTADIKDNAVTTTKIKRGAVTADRIASGVVPAKTVHVARVLALSGAVTPLLRLGGLSFDASCGSGAQDFVGVVVTRTGGGQLTASGLFSVETSTSDASYPYVDEQNGMLDVSAIAPTNDGFAAIGFNGVVTPAGRPPVQVQVTVQVDDNTATPCQTYVTSTPIG